MTIETDGVQPGQATFEGIKLEPTWEGLLPAMLAVLENGTDKGKQLARVELRRMARAADFWNAANPHLPVGK